MNILFCGTIVPEEYDTKLKYLSPAGNRFQINVIRELERQGHKVTVLSYIGFPMESDISFEKSENDISSTVRYIYKKDGFVSSLRAYTGLIKEEAKKCDLAMSYNVIYAWFRLPEIMKRAGKKSLLLLADFTESSMYTSKAKQLYAKLQLVVTRKYNLVVGLSQRTKELLKENQKFLLIEGGISQKVYGAFADEPQRDPEVTFMYSGLLEPVTGIDLLLEAFAQVKNADIRLIVSGKGSMESLVEAYAERDTRIVNAGYMEYDRYLETIAKADVVVNPRNMLLPENCNNFPSKIMEYLATGNHIVSTRFIGNEKFEEYVTFCESSVADIKDKLEQLAANCRENAGAIRNRNREFAKQFLWENQIKRLIIFTKGCS